MPASLMDPQLGSITIYRARSPIFLCALCAVLQLCWACSSGSSRERVYEADPRAVFQASLAVVGELSWQVSVANDEAGFIQAKTLLTFRTFGDLITIEVRSLGRPRETSVKFSSTSAQLLDQTAHNSKALFDLLDARLGVRR